MKEFIWSRDKDLTLLAFSSALALAITHAIMLHNHKSVVPLYMNVNVGAEEVDNNLSGNAGISADYYSRQIRQSLESSVVE